MREILSWFEPETAHRLAIDCLRLSQATPLGLTLLRASYRPDGQRLAQSRLGCRFPNPIGLAAGFDKDGVAIRALAAIGFGFLEVGTVTPRAQAGNPRPRLFRYPEAESLQNALGFNNGGIEALVRRLDRVYPAPVPLGVNIGKNRDTPLERAAEDYAELTAALDGRCDYLVVNVSSPNTPGLRDLQSRESLEALLPSLAGLTRLPLLVKLSPDLGPSQASDLARAAVDAGAAGIVLTNTTADYGLLPGARSFGGLSGRVLRDRSFALLESVAGALFGRCTLISVGGVDSGAEAYRRLRAGASLVQLYSALVFRGPGLVVRIVRELEELLDRDGIATASEAVGAALRGRRIGLKEVQ